MSFIEEVQIALKKYDKQKGFFSRFFGDSAAIKATRKLSSSANLSDLFRIYSHFYAYNLFSGFPKPSQAAYGVYEAIIKYSNLPKRPNNSLFSVLEDIYTANILSKENIDILIKLDSSKLGDTDPDKTLGGIFINAGVSSVSKILNKRKLLTETAFHIILRCNNFSRLMKTLEKIDFLTTETHHFLYTEECHQIVWSRLPSHLWTQAVIRSINRLAQEENPTVRIRQYVDQLLGINRNTIITVNDAQNTHHTSVHQSVSDSASKLKHRYAQMIAGNRLKETLDMISEYITKLPDDSKESKAAKRCIKRMHSLNYTDPKSKITILELLALTFLAIHDKENRIGDLIDARKQFIQGLYEIQRGYNLSANGLDDGKKDKPICTSGTFNKLLEKIEGIHLDVKILHITVAVASLKLPIIVRDVAIDYLSRLANTQTISELHQFTRLITQIGNDECVDVIWNEIKTEIANRLFNEFSILYKNEEDPQFIQLVEGGQYLKLTDLHRFQKQILDSSGYRQYCSLNLRWYARFYPFLEENSYSTLKEIDNRQLGFLKK